ncbi:MAG TPA: sodium ion-translocating decarboxylase subunit beta [Syntrophorhabdaceae bacterium]|nr:sodium ion-translocating decarboxylase subunit beta [Syntrophorhabdaceae bacterium]
MQLLNVLYEIFLKTGIPHLDYRYVIMWLIGCLFMYLAIKKDFEPLLLVPIGFSIFLVNMPIAPLTGPGQLINLFFKYGRDRDYTMSYISRHRGTY